MKKILFALVLSLGFLTSFTSVEARTVRVNGYYKPSTGTYVSPSYRTSPNSSKYDNYSTKGNYNPYSGRSGTVDPYKW